MRKTSVRTTVTFEPDVAERVRQAMEEKELSLKRVVNDFLRRGFAAKRKERKPAKFKVQGHSFGFKPGVDLDKVGQLLDELEVQEYLRKMNR